MSIVTKQALDIIDRALEIPPEERRAYLDSACLDASLREYVESLLGSYEYAEDFLREPALFAQEHVWVEGSTDSWLGRRIGHYQLIEEIGEGGMGVVYRAVRADDQYRKEVAIKLLRTGLDNRSTLVRFKAERQILASLEQPNIARLLDGGATSEDLPYFVMELVDGLPIDQYCDQHKLTTCERLKLFRSICSAVHYAHNRSVIHRDLKPSNVLVTRDGTPKLLDFGIAKILDPASFPGTAIEPTVTLMRVLTPEYASPEQMRGEPTAAASDVYSLGVILYIVLTGHRPYNLQSRSPHEIAEAVCHIDPAKPSSAVSRSEEITNSDGTTVSITPESTGRSRGEGADKLRRQLVGDLDNIVLKALRKEPKRRYLSADEFSEDIRRHLESLPVLARRDTATYRIGKFVRRNLSMVCASFLLLLAVTAGTISFVWRSHSAVPPSSAKASSVRMRPSIAVLGFKNLSGRTQSDWLSTALSEILNTELAAGEQLRTVPGETVARMKNDLALSDSESYASDSLSRIRKYLGADYVIVGSYLEANEESGEHLRLDLRLQDAGAGLTIASVSETGVESQLDSIVTRAAKSLRAKLAVGEHSPVEVSAVQASLPSAAAARFYAQGLILLRASDAMGARTLLEQAVHADPRFAMTHSALASAWSQLGYDGKAADESKRALELSSELSRADRLGIEALYSEATHDWPKAIETYSTLYHFFPDNLEYGLRLVAMQNKAGKGKDALLTLQALRKLPPPARDDPAIDLAEAVSAQSVSDYNRQSAASAVAIQKADGARMRSLMARALVVQSQALRHLAQPAKAMAAVISAKQIYDQIHDRGGMAASANSLGNILYDTGDLNGAKSAFEESLQLFRDIGNDHGTAAALGNLSNVVGDMGDLSGAIRLNEQSMVIYRRIGEKLGMGNVLNDIGTDLTIQGNLVDATKAFQQALAIKQEIGDQNGAAECLNNLGDILVLRGEIRKAESSFEEAIRIRQSLGLAGSLASPLEGLGEALAEGGDLPAAKQHLNEALAIANQSGDKHLLSLILSTMGDIQAQEGDLGEARKSYQQALEIRNTLGEKGNAQETALGLAELAMEEGNSGEARSRTEEALNEFSKEKIIDDQVLAHVMLARTLISESRTAEALKEISLAEQIASKSQNRLARIKLSIVSARADEASGRSARAISTLESALADSKQHGLILLEFQVSLALGQIEMKTSRMEAGQNRLKDLQRQANEKGFALIARKATASLTHEAAGFVHSGRE